MIEIAVSTAPLPFSIKWTTRALRTSARAKKMIQLNVTKLALMNFGVTARFDC